MSQRVVGLRNGPGICLLRSCACVCVVCVFLASFSRGVQWNKGGQAAAAAAAHPCYAFGLAFARHELGDGTPALPWWEGPGRLQRLFERALRRDRPGLVLAHGGPIVGAESWVDLEILGLWGLVWSGAGVEPRPPLPSASPSCQTPLSRHPMRPLLSALERTLGKGGKLEGSDI